MRTCKLVCFLALVACGGGSDTKHDAGVDAPSADAPGILPMLTSFTATPASVTPGVPTMVTWNWTYASEPTFPDPACSIDNGVGAVTRGQATAVTLTAVTTFRLTCTNFVGSAEKIVVVAIPQASPSIASFTASPSTLTPGVPTIVTWSWTYTGYPSPAPTCTIENVGAVAQGGTSTEMLTSSRTYMLKCTNSLGTQTAFATLNIDECASGLHDCQAHATCVDNPNGFSCQCNTGYSGNGDVCSVQNGCAGCSANASCSGTSCVCNAGYVGDGLTCTRMRMAFTTSTTGTGNLATWANAGGLTGLAAADNVCAAAATAGGMPAGTYVAWMSDSNNDAYCRIHGLTGKKVNNCGQASLPVSAGPWARKDGQPVAPTIDKLLAPTRATYRPANLNESGTAITTSGEKIYTGTDETGVYTAACNNWVDATTSFRGTMGEIAGGGTAWTHALTTDPTCNTLGHLRCMEVTAGPALPSRHPAGKRIFLTSVSGNGNLNSWADAGGLFGVSAGDAICQTRARYAGFANPQSFKAWLSTSTSAPSRLVNVSAAYVRPDGVIVAPNKSAMSLSPYLLQAPIDLTETGVYAVGNDDTGSVWTGTYESGGSTFTYCTVWQSPATTGTVGRWDVADYRWTDAVVSFSCVNTASLYCVED